MELVLLLVVIVAVPVVALLWSRRGRRDEPAADPQARRDPGAGGPPQHVRGSEWGGGSSNI